jgi:hypothetical protein
MDMGFHDHTEDIHTVISVHLYENFARGITVSHTDNGRARAEDIQRIIQDAFPRLPVRLERGDAQPEDGQIPSESALSDGSSS